MVKKTDRRRREKDSERNKLEKYKCMKMLLLAGRSRHGLLQPGPMQQKKMGLVRLSGVDSYTKKKMEGRFALQKKAGPNWI